MDFVQVERYCMQYEIIIKRKKERKKEERETHMGFSCYDNHWILVQKALDKLDCSTV